jgi:hypothetical protein
MGIFCDSVYSVFLFHAVLGLDFLGLTLSWPMAVRWTHTVLSAPSPLHVLASTHGAVVAALALVRRPILVLARFVRFVPGVRRVRRVKTMVMTVGDRQIILLEPYGRR